MREEIIQRVLEHKIVVIVRNVYGEECVKLAKALYAGGIALIEVTFDQSRTDSWSDTSDTIARLHSELGKRMFIGAGTVTSIETLELARDAGARFIVSPDTNRDIIKATVASDMVSIPGALTPTEILRAHEAGADFVKVFPVSSLGAAYLKAVRGPISHVRLLAVGGVSEKNIGEFLQAGCVGAGVGGNLVNREWIRNGEFSRITALSREFQKAVG